MVLGEHTSAEMIHQDVGTGGDVGRLRNRRRGMRGGEGRQRKGSKQAKDWTGRAKHPW